MDHKEENKCPMCCGAALEMCYSTSVHLRTTTTTTTEHLPVRQLRVLVCPSCLYWEPCNKYGESYTNTMDRHIKRLSDTVGEHDNRLDQIQPPPPFDSGNCGTCRQLIPNSWGGSCRIGNDTHRAACRDHTGLKGDPR
jgi:hypothetical protein